jgi:hypothetical protein
MSTLRSSSFNSSLRSAIEVDSNQRDQGSRCFQSNLPSIILSTDTRILIKIGMHCLPISRTVAPDAALVILAATGLREINDRLHAHMDVSRVKKL